MPRSGYWNHNVHYQPVILNAVPPGCRTPSTSADPTGLTRPATPSGIPSAGIRAANPAAGCWSMVPSYQ
jgi:hypothetical protein